MCEIVINRDGIKHRADISTKGAVIIELQNSTILAATIREREEFYGRQMIWVINGSEIKMNFTIYSSKNDSDDPYYQFHNPLSTKYGNENLLRGNELRFKWKKFRKSWSRAQRPVFIDFGDEYMFWITEGMGSSRGRCKKTSKKNFLLKYGGNIDLLDTLINNS